jgi:protein-S-isoprenylcysteine O-methyltransferase Ste14
VLSFTLLVPCTVVAFAPYFWIMGPARVASRWPPLGLSALGFVPLAIGLAIYVACARRFAVEGLGTPAPYDPPRRLVTGGLFRWTRNPFYVGIVTILLGEAAVFASLAMVWYALVVAVAFHLRVLLYEEPVLRRLFGDEFERYAREVPRWVPRLTRRARAGAG